MKELPLAPDWTTDILGSDYQRRTFALGPDPDGEGTVIATLVRRRVPATSDPNAPAMVFVHGMSDYFFHTHVAEFFTAAGWAVYGVDLRKCGRSWREGQRWHHTSELKFYFADLTAVFDYVRSHHPTVVWNGHSTGGLTLALWFDYLRRRDPARHADIAGAVLNSPWLELMYARPKVHIGTLLYNVLGKIRPAKQLAMDPFGSYGKSLHTSEYGDWNYNVAYKPFGGQPKNYAWLRTILLNQRSIHRGDIECELPLLVLCSTETWLRPEFSERVHSADGVLDVHQIHRWARTLSPDVTIAPIPGARHDVYLSRPEPLATALETTLRWASSLIDAPPSRPDQK